jgi:eukaryotic-like serine/threonine-protein kinase
MVTFQLRRGFVLSNKYRIEEELGRGGMGVVYRAIQIELDRQVALKFLLPEAQASREALSRFKREARSLALVENEHVVKVIETEEYEGAPYLVMEYLRGNDLAEVIHKQGALPLEVAVGYVLQSCEALAEVHSLDIVHRDLKPSNLFLTDRHGAPLIKVFDFGIAKASLSELSQVGSTQGFVGSLLYCAPEQLSSPHAVDARADVWALGVTLFELVTGSPPFRRGSFNEVMADRLNATAPDVRKVRRDVPEGVATTIAACLERDPKLRIADVEMLAVRLAEFAPPNARQSLETIARVRRAARSDPPRASIEQARAQSATLPAPAPAGNSKPSNATLTATFSTLTATGSTLTATGSTLTASGSTLTASGSPASVFEARRTQTISESTSRAQKRRPPWRLALAAPPIVLVGAMLWSLTEHSPETTSPHGSAPDPALAEAPTRETAVTEREVVPAAAPTVSTEVERAMPIATKKPSLETLASTRTAPLVLRQRPIIESGSSPPPRSSSPPPPSPASSGTAAGPAKAEPGTPALLLHPW